MSDIVRIAILICGATFTGIILYLLIVRKINEKNSVVWLLCAIVILAVSAVPQILDKAAEALGIYYPPTLLFLVSTLVLLLCILYSSMQISALQEKIKKLAQQDAVNKLLIEQKLGELEKIVQQNGERDRDKVS